MGKESVKVMRLFLFCFAFLSSFHVISQENKMSLRDCLNYGLENSPMMTIANNRLASFKYDKRDIYAPYMPKVNASAQLDYNIKVPTTIVPMDFMGLDDMEMRMGLAHSNTMAIQLDQTIYDQSAISAMKSVDNMDKLAHLNSEKDIEDMLFNIAMAYYQILAIEQQISLLKANHEQYEELERILSLQLEKGVVKTSDYNQIKVAFNNIKAQLSTAKTSKKVALNQLKTAMGMETDMELNIDQDEQLADDVSLPESVAPDISSRLDFRINMATEKLQETQMKATKYGFLPTLSGYAQYGGNSYSDDFRKSFDSFYEFSAVGLKLTIPIFNGLQVNSAYNRELINLENLRAKNKLEEESFKVDFMNAQAELEEAYSSYQMTKQNMELAEELHDATSLSYQKGAATLSDFLNADYSYKEAQTNYTSAMIKLLTSRLELEKSKGNLSNYLNK